MPLLSALANPVWEAITLRRAERTALSYSTAQRERVCSHFEAGEQRWRAGRRLDSTVPAAALLRDAVVHYLTAIEAARDPDADEDAIAARDLASTLPTLPADPARPRADPSDDARVRAAVASQDSLVFDRMSQEDAERARWALDRAATMLRRRIEPRSVVNVRATRWGRVAAAAILVTWAALATVKAKLAPVNIALGKPVHASSHGFTPPDEQTITDGKIGTAYGVHTETEDSPSATVDLDDVFLIDRVDVYNRVDGWFDGCLPLVVELSEDGHSFTEIGRRENHFGTDPPWHVSGRRQPARYVRVRVARKSALVLSEVAVYGNKR
jgi:hypothetical protein